LIRRSFHLLAALALGATTCFSIGCQGRPTTISVAEQRVSVREHGAPKELFYFVCGFNSGLGSHRGYLAERVPSIKDRDGVTQILDAPPYRRKDTIYRAIDLITQQSNYPWKGRLHWVVGTDPFIIGVGKNQGVWPREVVRYFPFVGPAAATQPVDTLIIFDDATWPRLARARKPADVAAIPRHIVRLSEETALEQILTHGPDH
jgi:hypothetical protein